MIDVARAAFVAAMTGIVLGSVAGMIPRLRGLLPYLAVLCFVAAAVGACLPDAAELPSRKPFGGV